MTRLFLDTHVYFWSVMNDRKLTKAARRLILEADEFYVSSASIWEASIKVGPGKLEADIDLLVPEIEASGFVELPVRPVTQRRGAICPTFTATRLTGFWPHRRCRSRCGW